MSQVVTLPIDSNAEQLYHHASVNYSWEADKRTLSFSVLTLAKMDQPLSEQPYLELRITYNKVLPGGTVEEAVLRSRADERGNGFNKLITQNELFGGPSLIGSHIDILDTALYAYDSKTSKTPTLFFGKHLASKELSYAAHCVLEGTKVQTKAGWVPIENLMPGDKVIAHNGDEKKILKRAVWNLKYESSPICNDGRVFKVEGGYAGRHETVFVSYHHKIYTYYKQFIKAGHARFQEATKEEIAPKGYYKLYNIQIEDHKKNHLVVGGGLIIESWDGLTDSKVKTKIVSK
jgi:hypothetical protein